MNNNIELTVSDAGDAIVLTQEFYLKQFRQAIYNWKLKIKESSERGKRSVWVASIDETCLKFCKSKWWESYKYNIYIHKEYSDFFEQILHDGFQVILSSSVNNVHCDRLELNYNNIQKIKYEFSSERFNEKQIHISW